jgi:hypothetical protein
MNKSGYDFWIQSAEIDKEDIKYFKQWNHRRPVLLVIVIKIDVKYSLLLALSQYCCSK